MTVAPEQLLALFAAKDLNALIDTAFDVVRATVECDFASAFYVSGGNGLLKQRDSLGRESNPAFMRRHIELNPAIPLAIANRGIKIMPTSWGLPQADEELRQSVFYREIMQPEGWRHAVALCFWGDPPAELPIFVASAQRADGRSDFSGLDIANLERVHPFLDGAINRLHEREVAKAVRDGMALVVRDETRGFAILDGNLLLVQANPTARRLCAAWLGDEAETLVEDASRAWPLPAALESRCRELHREWQSALRGNPDTAGLRHERHVTHPHHPELTASITMVCPDASGLTEPTFVLEFNRHLQRSAVDASAVSLLERLTAAERAVVMVAADGLSNQDIADQLGKTVAAVKFLLHRIYTKTGVPNRAALVAALRSRSNG